MSRLINRQTQVDTILAADVANSGTFDVGYPTGTTQESFLRGRAGSNNYIVQNNVNKFTTISLSYGASTITVTNSTGITLVAGSTIRVALDQTDGDDVQVITVPVSLAAITGAGDVLTEIHPSIAGDIAYWEAAVKVPVTTAAKLATLNLEIGTTNVTGGTIALTSANCTPLGAVIGASAITAANTLSRDSKLSIEAASVTAFAEGEIILFIYVRKNLVADDY